MNANGAMKKIAWKRVIGRDRTRFHRRSWACRRFWLWKRRVQRVFTAGAKDDPASRWPSRPVATSLGAEWDSSAKGFPGSRKSQARRDLPPRSREPERGLGLNRFHNGYVCLEVRQEHRHIGERLKVCLNVLPSMLNGQGPLLIGPRACGDDASVQHGGIVPPPLPHVDILERPPVDDGLRCEGESPADPPILHVRRDTAIGNDVPIATSEFLAESRGILHGLFREDLFQGHACG